MEEQVEEGNRKEKGKKGRRLPATTRGGEEEGMEKNVRRGNRAMERDNVRKRDKDKREKGG